MPFKIVQTSEKGSNKLFIVPSGWEGQGQVRYPKKAIEYKLTKDEKSKPRAEWPVMSCKVKRTGFPTYKDADEELSIMMGNSDTDCHAENQEKHATTATAVPDYNYMADELMFHSQAKVASKSLEVVTQELQVLQDVPVTQDAYHWYLNENEIVTTSDPPTQTDIVTQTLNTILENQIKIMDAQNTILMENQNKIMGAQNKFAHRLGEFVIELETRVEKTITRVLNRHFNQNITTLSQANPIENTAFNLKPIDSIQELEELELLLFDPVEKHKLMKLYSVLCTITDGHGITCAYKLIDVLFTREFLCKCSWSGGSRGDTIKIALKGYKNLLEFCFRMVFFWDKTYTIEKQEQFFKAVLRNAGQRNKVKKLRAPTMRKRKVHKQYEKPENTKTVVSNENTDATISKEKDNADTEIQRETDIMKKVVEKEIDEEMEIETEKYINMEEEAEKETENKTEVSQNVETENREEFHKKPKKPTTIKIKASDDDIQLSPTPQKKHKPNAPKKHPPKMVLNPFFIG